MTQSRRGWGKGGVGGDEGASTEFEDSVCVPWRRTVTILEREGGGGRERERRERLEKIEREEVEAGG